MSVVRCEWDSVKCNETELVPVMTDAGKCFTFNYDENKMHYATQPGMNRCDTQLVT